VTHRERRERRAARLREWAAKRTARSEVAFERAHDLADQIPLGQPILVGHHSERRHCRDLARIDGAMEAGVEHGRMADQMSRRAGNIEATLEASIYDDDPGRRRAAPGAHRRAGSRARADQGVQRLLPPRPAGPLAA
jgi:uncharacterized protein DUF3560